MPKNISAIENIKQNICVFKLSGWLKVFARNNFLFPSSKALIIRIRFRTYFFESLDTIKIIFIFRKKGIHIIFLITFISWNPIILFLPHIIKQSNMSDLNQPHSQVFFFKLLSFQLTIRSRYLCISPCTGYHRLSLCMLRLSLFHILVFLCFLANYCEPLSFLV